MEKTNSLPFGVTNITTGTYSDVYGTPERVAIEEYPDRIEMIYKQTSMYSVAIYPPRPPHTRVFKIVFSCVDGKWNKSEPIFGKIIPSQDEYYEFEK